MMSYPSVAEGLARGRLILTKCTHQDFGYDLMAWHDYLAETNSYSYRSRMKSGIYPDSILKSLNDPDWLDAVYFAESTSIFQRLQYEDRNYREAVDWAERLWSGKLRDCPKCDTTFKSVQDRGQCPQCRLIFYASHPDGYPDWWRKRVAEQRVADEALDQPL